MLHHLLAFCPRLCQIWITEPKVRLTHAQENKAHLPQAWLEKAVSPHTRSEGRDSAPRPLPRSGSSQGAPRDPSLPPSHAAVPLSSSLFSREETGNLAIIIFFSIFFFLFSFFSRCERRGPAGGQRCRVPAGARCRRGCAVGARRPRGDKAGDGPRLSRPYCVSEEEMDEGHILPLFRCPAPGKSCAL